MTDSVAAQTPVTEHVGNGVTTSFAYTFTILDSADMVVELDGVVQGSGFTVSGVGVLAGGAVLFTTAPASDVSVLLRRSTDLSRSTSYTYAGDLRETVVDEDFNRLWHAMQERAEVEARSMRAPVGETLDALPPASQRADTQLLFDNTGEPYCGAPASGSAADVMLQYASTDAGKGASLVGVADAGGYFAGANVEGVLQEIGLGMRGRLRDIRTFSGIVADNATNDRVALQAAFNTARDEHCGIWIPPNVKLYLEFDNTNHCIFITGDVNLVGGDKFSCGFRVHCTENLVSNTTAGINAGHDPIFCWGIPSKGAAVSKVRGRVQGIGTWITTTTGRFERMNHIYGATDFTVEDCYADFTAKTWPQADGDHTFGYQAGTWFSSNVQPTWATGQTQDRNIQFIRNVGFASAEYQNGESVGITRCKGLRYIRNYFYGFADDLSAHECVDVLMLGNHYEAVTGRLYFDNCQHVKIVDNYITSIQKPSGGFVGPARTYITGNMAVQYAAITYDPPNYDVVVHGNTVEIPSGGYCTSAVQMYGVQDGLTITDNHFYMSGSPAAQAAAIGISTLYRAGWTGPAGNPDYAAGGAVKLRSVTVRGNQCIGAGWGATDGNLSVVAYPGGASSDIIGPVDIDGNIAGAYYIPYEPVRFGRNFATPAATDPFLNLSMLTMWDKQPPLWVGLLPASANINNTNFPQATPTFYTLSDSDGMKFIAQRAGRVLGAHMQLTANMTAGNNCVLRVLNNGTQIGADTDSATNSPTTNPSRYIWNFAGVAGMTFAEGDKIELQVTIRTAQGGTSIVGRINLVAQYA